jgi:ubiquitin carboxyl-terminal hydrolase 10
MRAAPESSNSTAPSSSLPTPTPSVSSDTPESGGWLEVGPRQRAAITRSSGHASTSSPVNRIFGGKQRSEFKVPGLKPSVTLQTYQSLQLDIGSPDVRNIVDALKGIPKPETIHGDFGSPHGKDVPGAKQLFLETLPSVLILHLKRFQFEGDGYGTVKIWKKVGYPLDLEIPREVLSRGRRNAAVTDGAGLPKYRLTAVVYHHGKHASGGHYTADVLRQDEREWIRLDDTNIRRVRSEDVAEGGAEEDASSSKTASATADTVGKKESGAGSAGNRFASMGEEDAGEGDEGWKQVSAPASGGTGKKWSSVVNGGGNGTAGGTVAKQSKESVKDNKVAYLLFYQQQL